MSVLLEARGVCKYFGGLKAVDNVNMLINQGDIFGIIGPNGAGKTTFFNTCTGIYPPTKGEIYLDGEKISHLQPEQIARHGMARTFQNIQLFKYMTVAENIKIGFHTRTQSGIFDAILHSSKYKKDEQFIREQIDEVLEEVKLTQYRDIMAGNLPYGIQRKVEIARAIALKPKILLLDEPAAGMNPNETEALRIFIKDLNAHGYTIAVIEHDMKFIMNSCNRILVLNFGHKICEGSPAEVNSNKDVQEAYFGKGTITRGKLD
jgi:branched-chain amino acid transport system ATP-binding protein